MADKKDGGGVAEVEETSANRLAMHLTAGL
jgi:hypothetical protein